MIMEQVDYEIKLSGFAKKLIAGVVLTGGGAQLKNIKDLCELITTTDTRIGIPNEHLEVDSVGYAELTHPMYATGIGLVLYGLEQCETPESDKLEKQVKTDHVDIFASMDDLPAAPAAKPVETPKAEPKEKKQKEDTFGNAVSRFFNKVFNEGIDE